MRLTGHNGAIYKIIDLDSNHFLSGGGEGWIVKWDKTGKNVDGQLIAKANSQIFSMTMIPNSDLLIVGCMSGDLLWINMTAKSIVKKYQLTKYAIYDILAVGDHFYSLGADGYITSWDPLRMSPIVSKSISNKALRKCVYDAETNQLIIGSSDGNIYFIDPTLNNNATLILDAHSSSVFALTLHEGVLYSGGRDAKIKIWDIEHKMLLNTIDAHWFTVNDLNISKNGKRLISSSRDKTVRIWNTKTKKPILVDWNEKHVNSVNSLLLDESNQNIISCSDDRTIIIQTVNQLFN